MLGVTTFTFVRMLNKRFGEAEFSGPKCKFFTFLFVFSLSFAIRGSWDLGIYIDPIDIHSKTDYAIILFVLYFVTEWLPIFVIYLTHLWAFHALVQRHKSRSNDAKNSHLIPQSADQCMSQSTLLDNNQDKISKNEEFRLLLANVPKVQTNFSLDLT